MPEGLDSNMVNPDYVFMRGNDGAPGPWRRDSPRMGALCSDGPPPLQTRGSAGSAASTLGVRRCALQSAGSVFRAYRPYGGFHRRPEGQSGVLEFGANRMRIAPETQSSNTEG